MGLMFTTAAEARGKRDKATPEQRQARFEQHQKKMAEKVRTKLAKRLELDAATTEQLVTLLQDAMVERRTARQQVHTQRKALRELVKSGATDAQIDTAVANLRRAMDNMPKKDALLDDAGRLLTPTQEAKFLLASNRFFKRGHRMHHGKRGKKDRQGHRGQSDNAATTDVN